MMTACARCLFLALFLSCRLQFAETQPSPWSVIKVHAQGDASLNRILFTNDRVGWICAGLNTILKTADGGRTWAVQKTNLAVPGTDISGIWFADENRGWAVGAIGHQPVIWQTHNGGETWGLQQSWPRAYADSLGAALDIQFVDDAHGWAVGFNGFSAFIVATDDGGRHWTTQYSGSEITGQFKRVQFRDLQNGWALSDGAVMQTRDGGESWQLRYFDPALLNAIDVVSPSEVWVAGAWGHLLHTRNGVAWSQVPIGGPLGDHFFGYVKIIGTDRGWAWGTKCDILSTRDTGKTWVPEACPLAPEVRAEITTGEMARSASRLFMIANPGYVLVRSIE